MSHSGSVSRWGPETLSVGPLGRAAEAASPVGRRRRRPAPQPARAFRFGPAYERFAWDLLVLWDSAVMPATAAAAASIGAVLGHGATVPISWAHPEMSLSLIGALLAPIVLYSRERPPATSQTVLRTSALFLLLLAIAAFTGLFWSLSVFRLGLWLTIAATATVLGRTLVDTHLAMLRSRGLLGEHVAIAGAGVLSERLRRDLEGRARPVRVAGIFDNPDEMPDKREALTGSLSDLIELGRCCKLDSVLLVAPRASNTGQTEMLRQLMTLDVEVFAVNQDPVDSRCLRCDLLVPRPTQGWGGVLKALEDRVLALILLIVLAPLLLGAILAVWLGGSSGPIFFRQRRHGLGNSEFEILKLRTMVWDGAAADGAMQTRIRDPRITAVGGFLRRTSLDELPQLFNVLAGQMSIVGPRPHPIAMRTQGCLCEELAEDYGHRHRVKPGITGWAQVNGCRGATERPEQLRRRLFYDLDYVARWSLLFDLKILLLTPWSLLVHRCKAF